MKEVDYIIVGLGIGGISVCEELIRRNKKLVVYDIPDKSATTNSGGVMNPTVLKRFSAVWKAELFYPEAMDFYQKLSQNLGATIVSEESIFRIFSNVEEVNNWSVAGGKERLKDYLGSNHIEIQNKCIHAPFGYGEVRRCLKISVDDLLREYRKYIGNNQILVQEKFDYRSLQSNDEGVVYKNFKSKNIIFCEGPSVVNNPFFPTEKIKGNKGEYLIIQAPALKLNKMIKGPVYLIPIGEDRYKVGATFAHDDDSWDTTERAKEELLEGLKKILKCDFEVVGQTAGIRATTFDRHPLIGKVKPGISFLSGLGTRGFLMAPALGKMLVSHIEENTVIPEEMDINRPVSYR